jgi:hypothetical protein
VTASLGGDRSQKRDSERERERHRLLHAHLHVSFAAQGSREKRRRTHQALAPVLDDGAGECGKDGLGAWQGERACVARSERVGEERRATSNARAVWIRMARVCINVGIGVEIEVGAAALSPE